MSTKLCLTMTLLVALMSVAGCYSSEYDQAAYDFDPQQSRTRAILDAQYAKGAAEDAALGEHHFDGIALNGLGQDKLERALAHRMDDALLVVHLDFRGASLQHAEARLKAVRDYLEVRGVALTDGSVVLGPSPRSARASDAMAGLNRLEQRSTAPAGAGSATADVVANQTEGLFSGQ